MLPKPMPVGFELPADLDLQNYDEKKNAATTVADRKSAKVATGTVIAVMVGILLYSGASTSGLKIIASLFVGWIVMWAMLYGFLQKQYLPSCFKGDYDANVSRYRFALLIWQESELETGVTYWREKRGVAFELALKRMFEKRGSNVTMTKGSGDGGVDLIIRHAGNPQTIWGQCKGHAKPIGVAPVREIAGVCSRGQALPALFAVNGFTKAAKLSAEEFGVTLYDAGDIAAFARKVH